MSEVVTTKTPKDVVAEIAAFFDKHKETKEKIKEAHENLDKEKVEALQKEFESIYQKVKELMRSLTETSISDERCVTLIKAAKTGASPLAMKNIAEAKRVSSKKYIELPKHRFEYLSRGRGWCRQGTGSNAIWGERTENGYKVDTPGKWSVGGHDGFTRKREDIWIVEHVKVGEETWTIAY